MSALLPHTAPLPVRAQTAEGEEAETWSFLGLLYENDARRELLRKLGFQDVVQVRGAARCRVAPLCVANGAVCARQLLGNE